MIIYTYNIHMNIFSVYFAKKYTKYTSKPNLYQKYTV